MRDLLPILAALCALLAGAFAAAVGVVVLATGSCSRSAQQPALVLIYEVDPQQQPSRPVDVHLLVTAVDRRINQGPFPSARIRPLDDRRIEIGVFANATQQVQRIERLLQRPGTLELRILANRRDHAALIERAQRDGGDVLTDAKGNVQAWWVPVHSLPLIEEREYPLAMPGGELVERTRKQGRSEVTKVLVVKDPFDVTGAYLEQAKADRDDFGRPCVGLVLDSAGAQRLGALTSDNLPDAVQGFARRLGIIVDGQLYSAPAIRSPISKDGKITDSFTRQQVEDLLEVLNAGPLPAALRLVEKRAAAAGQ